MRRTSLRLQYNDQGTLKGHTPKGQFLTIHHKQRGQSGFEVIWDGKIYTWFFQDIVKDELGIEVHQKRSGAQTGYPSEASQRAIWRHFVDRYNYGDPNVTYSP